LFLIFVTSGVDTCGKFTVSVIDTGDNWPPVLLTPTANLLPVSVEICHQYQRHHGYWWENLLLVSLIPVANLPLV
jgi:hypothetical protein